MRSLAFAALFPLVAAWQLPSSPALDRRSALVGVAAAAGAAITRKPLAASAAEASRQPDASVFVGTYTDPVHPGGTRTISLLSKSGPLQLAKVVGGGGVGEPESYELPAKVTLAADGSSPAITIDFSPKGGPKDFTGYWDGDGIRFPATPRQIERGNTAGKPQGLNS